MKFGVREICDVVLRAKAAQKIGNKVFYKNEPVLYFDSLKTSTLEGAATTVYAQGGHGNARLIAWEGERTVTFTMEDALISQMGFSVLTGAGLVEAGEGKSIITHVTEQIELNEDYFNNSENGAVKIKLKNVPYFGKEKNSGYIVDNVNGTYYKTTGEFIEATNDEVNENNYKNGLFYTYENNSYKIIPVGADAKDYFDENGIKDEVTIWRYSNNEYVDIDRHNGSLLNTTTKYKKGNSVDDKADYVYVMLLDDNGEIDSEPYIAIEDSVDEDGRWIKIVASESGDSRSDRTRYGISNGSYASNVENDRKNDISKFTTGAIVLVDYYVEKKSGAYQIDITPDKFGGNFYLEASTLFRATNGVDMPAEFIIPNCKIQSNFTFTMASSGDPSTFTFTMDAFPDYTRWDRTKKVYAAIQVIEESDTLADFERLGTPHNNGSIVDIYDDEQKDWIEKD